MGIILSLASPPHADDRPVGEAGVSAGAFGPDRRLRTAARTDPIGVATQDPDSSIILVLRAEGDAGSEGDARIRYAPSDPDYPEIARHVGPIPRGGSVPVRRFPER